jgi:hypothetical protein
MKVPLVAQNRNHCHHSAAWEKHPLCSGAMWLSLERAGCVLPQQYAAMTVAVGSIRGFGVNEKIANRLENRRLSTGQRERGLENQGIPGGIDTISWQNTRMAAESIRRPIRIWARYVKRQSPDGRFKCRAMRPPLETAICRPDGVKSVTTRLRRRSRS